MTNQGYIWGTYRRVQNYRRVLDPLMDDHLLGIDTAPNYQDGSAEREIGALALPRSTRIFGKVGYTSGDDHDLRALTGEKRHCLDPEYVGARVEASSRILFPKGGQFEAVLLHNPEHLWENVHEVEGDERFAEALLALGSLVSRGLTKRIGIATWTIPPNSARGSRILANLSKLGVAETFGFYMHPVSILRRELLMMSKNDFPDPSIRILSSAPLAGGEAVKLLGPVFSRFFQGVEDPVAQSLMLSQFAGFTPCIGIGSVKHSSHLSKLKGLPVMQASDLNDMLKLLDPS